MGEEVKGAVDSPLPGYLGDLTWSTFSDYIIETYGISGESQVWELIEQLDGLAMRDQRSASPGFANYELQRLALRDAALLVREEASNVLATVPALRSAIRAFERAVDKNMWSATMLEEVFEIHYVPSVAVDAPELFDSIRLLSTAEGWQPIQEHLEALTRLPVRERLRTNKVRNHVLEQALISCRRCWEECFGAGTWTRSTLSDLATGAVRHNGKVSNPLAGPCERFVSDMLTACGIDFKWKSLNGAWSALDKRMRNQRSQ